MEPLTLVSLKPAASECLLAGSLLILLVAGVIRGNGMTPFLMRMVAFLAALVALILYAMPHDTVTLFGGMFVSDRFAVFVKIIVAAGLALNCALASRYLREEGLDRFEYPILMLTSVLGMFLMISANHLMLLYVGLELQSLSLYVLASFRRNSSLSAEAGLKYFILGALSSGMLLFGISLVYGFTGTLSYTDIAPTVAGLTGGSLTGVLFGLVFILSGLAFKVSAVPFHMWTPDVYEGSPTSVTAFFAMVPKLAAMALIVRLLSGPFGSVMPQWQVVVIFLSVASMLWGAFAGLVQSNVKRLMAYSSIGNMGYALLGVVIGTQAGYAAAFYYMTIYMVMVGGVFAVLMYMRRDGMSHKSIEDFAGLSKTHPKLAYAMAILMFSLSGIPPMAGFFGKLFIFQVVVAQGMYAIAVIGVLTSVVAAYYYLRIIKVMFFDAETDPYNAAQSRGRQAVLGFAVVFALLFIFIPTRLLNEANRATTSLGGVVVNTHISTSEDDSELLGY
ncbi:MAG: NADH-quinone oxidoreductase subunit NuoN [Pseudobdellovibrionaceae bacterium]